MSLFEIKEAIVLVNYMLFSLPNNSLKTLCCLREEVYSSADSRVTRCEKKSTNQVQMKLNYNKSNICRCKETKWSK